MPKGQQAIRGSRKGRLNPYAPGNLARRPGRPPTVPESVPLESWWVNADRASFNAHLAEDKRAGRTPPGTGENR